MQQECPSHPVQGWPGRFTLGIAPSCFRKLPRKKKQIHAGMSPGLCLSPTHLYLPQELEQRQEQQKKIQAEIKHINDENQKRKEQQLEQERLADQRVLEYQKQKMVWCRDRDLQSLSSDWNDLWFQHLWAQRRTQESPVC